MPCRVVGTSTKLMFAGNCQSARCLPVQASIHVQRSKAYSPVDLRGRAAASRGSFLVKMLNSILKSAINDQSGYVMVAGLHVYKNKVRQTHWDLSKTYSLTINLTPNVQAIFTR